VPSAHNELESAAQQARPDVCRTLVNICQTLAADFEGWKSARSLSELSELRKAVMELHKKLSTITQLEEVEYLAASVPGGRA
jgi:hypothetical protein